MSALAWQSVAVIACDGAHLFVREPSGLWRLIEMIGFAADAGENHPAITPDQPKSPADHPVIVGDFRVISPPRQHATAHAAAQARYKAKCKAQGRPYGTLRQAKIGDPAADHRVISGDFAAAAPEKEEEGDPPSCEMRARDAPAAFRRKEGWAGSVMQRSAGANLLTRDEAASLWGELTAMRPDPSLKNWGLSRRANNRLDELERLLNARSPPQPTLPLPPVLIRQGARPPNTAPVARASPSPGRIIDGRWWPDHAFAAQGGT